MGVTDLFSSYVTLNIKYAPCSDVIVAITTAVRSSFSELLSYCVIPVRHSLL